MLLESVVILNTALGVFDAWITQRRMTDWGSNIELNRLIRWLSTRLGPQIAAIIGVMGPSVGWTYCLYFFNLGIPLAFLTGYNLKRFFAQVTSLELEKNAEVRRMLQELGESTATLPVDESTSEDSPSNLEGKK